MVIKIATNLESHDRLYRGRGLGTQHGNLYSTTSKILFGSLDLLYPQLMTQDGFLALLWSYSCFKC